MTEPDWLTCTDPLALLEHLRKQSTGWMGRVSDWLTGGGLRPSRKLLLVHCAYCRRYWHLVSWERRQKAIETIELVLDEAPISGYRDAALLTEDTSFGILGMLDESAHKRSAYWGEAEGLAARKALEEGKLAFCDLVRDVFGNPFRTAPIDASWLCWNGGRVINMAQSLYKERAFDSLPILADALEEAGCRDAEILTHCREPGPHVRGCWVLDLLLAKS